MVSPSVFLRALSLAPSDSDCIPRAAVACMHVFWFAHLTPMLRFALMNDKMGGDLDKIKVVGQYLIEVCCCFC